MLQWMKMDSNELKWARRTSLESMFNLSWITLGEPVQLVMDNTKRGPITRLPTNLGSNTRWKISKVICGQEIFID
jgi:hypothetical protein